MGIAERAGEFVNKIQRALQDPEVNAITGQLQGAIEAYEEGDQTTEQQHCEAIINIIDEHFPSVRLGKQPGEPRP